MSDESGRDALLEATPPWWVGGPRRRLDGPVILRPYDPGWPPLYERESRRIRGTLAARVIELHHVGSTSVPGLAAKPIIDVLLVVADSADEAAWLPDLEAGGYRLVVREPDWHEHRVLKGPDTDVNLHVFSPGAGEIRRMLAFRDHLRIDAGDRAAYLAAKADLAARTWAHVQDYADAKGEVVEAIIARALADPGADR